MSDDTLERRMEELRRMGLTEHQITDLVHRELLRSLPSTGSAETSTSDVVDTATGETHSSDSIEEGGADERGLVVPNSKLRVHGNPSDPDEPSAVLQVPGSAAVANVLKTLLLHQTKFSGPLPPPDLAAKYEEILPGFLERQVKLQERKADLAEREVGLTERAVDNQHMVRTRGQWLAGGVAMGFLVLAAFIGASSPAAGAAIAAFDVSALTAAFVLGRRKPSARAELSESEGEGEDE
ncbi:MAG: hypothetical protein KUG77_07360 [Nannocystaceae bacterium]|nr:hypothetical protein [Nannocystaceae bacterium]